MTITQQIQEEGTRILWAAASEAEARDAIEKMVNGNLRIACCHASVTWSAASCERQATAYPYKGQPHIYISAGSIRY